MRKITKGKNVNFKLLGYAGIALCALCCLLPLAAAVFGLAALASLATHVEKLAILFLSLSAIGFGIYFYRKSRQPKTCTADCNCNPAAEKNK